jgi:hypothetical protein
VPVAVSAVPALVIACRHKRLHPLITILAVPAPAGMGVCVHYLQYPGRLRLSSPVRDAGTLKMLTSTAAVCWGCASHTSSTRRECPHKPRRIVKCTCGGTRVVWATVQCSRLLRRERTESYTAICRRRPPNTKDTLFLGPALSLSHSLSLSPSPRAHAKIIYSKSGKGACTAPTLRPRRARLGTHLAYNAVWGSFLPTTLRRSPGRPPPSRIYKNKKPYWVIRLHPLSCAHYLQYLGRLRLSSPVRDTVINSG